MNRFLTFPTFSRFPSIWDDDDDSFLNLQDFSSQSGLSVYEDDKNVFVEAALPGIDPKKVEVTFDKGYLWVRGDGTEEEKDAKRKYYRSASRSFSYRVYVPGDIDSSIEPVATCKNGVMTVKFAKSPKAQPKKIAVKSE